MLKGFKVSYEAVRNWYHKKIYLIERKRRRYVAIDETEVWKEEVLRLGCNRC